MPGVLLDGGVEDHLHQHIAQLLPEQAGILVVDGFAGLIGLLQEVVPDGVVGLDAVPGAAVLLAQQMHQAAKIVDVVMGFVEKI